MALSFNLGKFSAVLKLEFDNLSFIGSSKLTRSLASELLMKLKKK